MRTTSTTLNNAATQPKTVGARVTFRKTRPVFEAVALTDSIGLTDPAAIDSCEYGTGILRVTNYDETLYTQYISDVGATWPAWTNTGIALASNSRPAVDAGHVWYCASNGYVTRRHYASWGTFVIAANNIVAGLTLAPLGDRCWWIQSSGSRKFLTEITDTSAAYNIYSDMTLPMWIDAVYVDGKEYLYLMDRAAGRIVEVLHVGDLSSPGSGIYGVGKPIIPIDALNDVYGLVLGYANVINGKVVVTGRLTRTSDGAPLVMDTYSIGPDQFSFGRDMFIQSDFPINGKMLLVGNKLIVSVGHYYIADATILFGNDNAALKLTTSDFAQFTLGEAESRSTTLDMEMSTELTHPAIARGTEATLEMTYDDGVNNDWVTLAKCDVDELDQPKDEMGEMLKIRGIGRSSKRLGAWSPDQGVYVPSQATMWTNPSTLDQMVRASGAWETVPQGVLSPVRNSEFNKLGVLYTTARPSRGGAMRGKFYFPAVTNFSPYFGVAINYYQDTAADYIALQNADAGIYGSTNPRLVYSGTWTTVANVNAYDGSMRKTVVRYSKVEFDFTGRRFSASWIKGPTGSTIPSVFIDGTKQDNLSSVEFTSKLLAPGAHHIELIADWGGISASLPVQLDKIEVLPQTSAEIGDNLGHNGILAAYGATEHNGAPGISLNLWRDGSMTKMTSVGVTFFENAWYWLQVEFVEGEIRVKYKLDTSNGWTEVLAHSYDQAQSPWPREALGRGAIVTMNCTPSRQHYGLGSRDGTVGSSDYVADFPATGTLIIDKERIDYSQVVSGWNGHQLEQYPMGSGLDLFDFTGSGISDANGMHCWNPYGLSSVAGAYDGVIVAFLEKDELTYELAWQSRSARFVGGRTLRMSHYVGMAPREWTAWYPEDGVIHKGNPSYGVWHADTPLAGRLFSFTEEPYASLGIPKSISIYGNDFSGLAAATLCGGFVVAKRGASNTTAAPHSTGKLSLFVNAYVLCDVAAYFTQDEDQSIEDAITSIVKLAGGKASCAAVVNTPHAVLGVVPVSGSHKNFIATFDLPALAVSGRVGVSFRGQGVFYSDVGDWYSKNTGGSYSIYCRRVGTYTYSFELYDNSKSPAAAVIENVTYCPLLPAGVDNNPIPRGEVKISVHDDLFSVWLNGRYIHTFHNTTYPTGDNVAFTSSSTTPFNTKLSELDDLLPDIVVGVRGNGMSVLGELIAERHIKFRDEPDGSLYFYRTRPDVGDLPDLVSSRDVTLTDTIVTRLRAEGMKLSEIFNSVLMKTFGNTFATINARYANTLVETEKEASLLMAEIAKGSTVYKYGMVPYPALQPGDTIHIGGDVISVRSQVISIGFQGDAFHADMQVEGMSSEAV